MKGALSVTFAKEALSLIAGPMSRVADGRQVDSFCRHCLLGFLLHHLFESVAEVFIAGQLFHILIYVLLELGRERSHVEVDEWVVLVRYFVQVPFVKRFVTLISRGWQKIDWPRFRLRDVVVLRVFKSEVAFVLLLIVLDLSEV